MKSTHHILIGFALGIAAVALLASPSFAAPFVIPIIGTPIGSSPTASNPASGSDTSNNSGDTASSPTPTSTATTSPAPAEEPLQVTPSIIQPVPYTAPATITPAPAAVAAPKAAAAPKSVVDTAVDALLSPLTTALWGNQGNVYNYSNKSLSAKQTAVLDALGAVITLLGISFTTGLAGRSWKYLANQYATIKSKYNTR